MTARKAAGRQVAAGLALTAGLVLAAGLGVCAQAQIAPSSNGPIDITADNGTLVNSTCEATWSGAAEALQGNSRLRADVIRAFLKKKPPTSANQTANQTDCGSTERIEADGNVFYVTPDQVAHGDHAVYLADSDQIILTGNVIVVQNNKNVVRGDKMTIQVSTRHVTIDSAARGRGTPGRVRGVFYPNQSGGVGGLGASLPGSAGPAR
ncbi:MAG TPA: LptA/OstA family protein [Caulobacteraceae bacterium]|jgi:lipopolysaccharide export system protein LptA|nr:LptA/OstA family protein [Caulobacteraceae bacterium]